MESFNPLKNSSLVNLDLSQGIEHFVLIPYEFLNRLICGIVLDQAKVNHLDFLAQSKILRKYPTK